MYLLRNFEFATPFHIIEREIWNSYVGVKLKGHNIFNYTQLAYQLE